MAAPVDAKQLLGELHALAATGWVGVPASEHNALLMAMVDALRARLARHRWTSAAFDTARWVRAFGEGVHMIVDNHRRGLPAKHLLSFARTRARPPAA